MAYATPMFDVGTYTEHKKIIFRIFLARLPTGNSCFVNQHFLQFFPLTANYGKNMFVQIKLTHPIYYQNVNLG